MTSRKHLNHEAQWQEESRPLLFTEDMIETPSAPNVLKSYACPNGYKCKFCVEFGHNIIDCPDAITDNSDSDSSDSPDTDANDTDMDENVNEKQIKDPPKELEQEPPNETEQEPPNETEQEASPKKKTNYSKKETDKPTALVTQEKLRKFYQAAQKVSEEYSNKPNSKSHTD